MLGQNSILPFRKSKRREVTCLMLIDKFKKRTTFFALALIFAVAIFVCGCNSKAVDANHTEQPPKPISSDYTENKKEASTQGQAEASAVFADSKQDSKAEGEKPKAESLTESSGQPARQEQGEEGLPSGAAAQSSEPSFETQQENATQSSSKQPQAPVPTSAVEVTQEPVRATKLTVRMPSASGEKTKSAQSAAIDYSNTSQGYIMVKYSGSNAKVKLQITGPNKVTYTYTLHKGGYVAFPLTAGSGSYTANVYENISGTSYSMALSCNFTAQLSSSLLPYLYPSQYVSYSLQSKAVEKGDSLAATATTKIGVVQQVYNYIINNIAYDSYKASTVKSGYTPSVDDTLATGKGICFDYAALMAAMLRTQDIPTRMEVGYVAGNVYHAWVSVYLAETGWINGIIQFDGVNWRMMDPTFAAGSAEPKSYTTAAYTYSVKYLY